MVRGKATIPRSAGITRRSLLIGLPALACAALCLGRLPGRAQAAGVSWDDLVFDRSAPLEYATQFALDYNDDGYCFVTIADGSTFLVVPPEAAVPSGVPGDVVVLARPLDRIYLVATQAMDQFRVLDAVSDVRLSCLPADEWYIEEAREAMEQGEMVYAGRYSAPDYELILANGCDLAIENTMVYHSPQVKEELEKLGIPVIVERSSYEGHPLARMEWVKFYGVITGKVELAEAVFEEQIEALEPILEQPATGKTVAYFYITSIGAVNIRKSGDYIATSIALAGGTYVPQGLDEGENSLSTMTIQMETFYAAARDADCIIYNSTIDGELMTINDLLQKSALLSDFKAVRDGNAWCTGQDLFQETMGLGDLILDIHAILTDDDVSDEDLVYLHHLI